MAAARNRSSVVTFRSLPFSHQHGAASQSGFPDLTAFPSTSLLTETTLILPPLWKVSQRLVESKNMGIAGADDGPYGEIRRKADTSQGDR